MTKNAFILVRNRQFFALVIATVFLALVTKYSRATTQVELVANGGFETGTLGPWGTSALGVGTCPIAPQDWNVSSFSNTGCSTVADPNGSTYAAYVMNDGGAAGLEYKLFQSVSIPSGTLGGTLTFDFTSVNSSDATRTLEARFYDLSGTTLLSTEFSESTSSNNPAWQSRSVDVSAFLIANAGTSVRLEFDNTIPGVWTGPGGLGLDNVSLLAEVPEPTTLALALTGLCLPLTRHARRRYKGYRTLRFRGQMLEWLPRGLLSPPWNHFNTHQCRSDHAIVFTRRDDQPHAAQ